MPRTVARRMAMLLYTLAQLFWTLYFSGELVA
jgi:hypothetical protein